MTIALRLRRYLESSGVPYTHCVHSPAYTAQEVAAAQHVPGRNLAKSVVLRAHGRFAMVVLPATMRLDVEQTRRVLQCPSARVASEEESASLFPDSEVGAMPPFGNLYGLTVYVDRTLTDDNEIVFNAGTHTETIRMKYDDFARLVDAAVIDAAVPIQAGAA